MQTGEHKKNETAANETNKPEGGNAGTSQKDSGSGNNHEADMPDESTKKENMQGYNELKEQEKVGGELQDD